MIRWLYKFSEKDYGTGKGLGYPELRPNGLLWILATAPTAGEFKKLKEDFGLGHTMRYCNERRSVRYSYMPALSFCIVDYYLNGHGEVRKSNILYWVKRGLVICVMPEKIAPYEEIFGGIGAGLKEYKMRASQILYDILDEDAEENFEVIEAIEKRIARLEKDMMDPAIAPHAVGSVIMLKRELTDMTRVFWCSAKILYSIRKGMTPLKLDAHAIRLLDDVHDTFIHQVDVVSTQKEILTDALTIYQATISNKLATISNKINNSVKKLTWIMLLLTGITLVLTIPNTLATIFGIPYFPIDSGHWFSVVAILAISTLLAIIWFWHYWRYLSEHDLKDSREKPLGGIK